MTNLKNYKNDKNDYQVIFGDCIDKLKSIESETVDLLIADPPYFRVVNQEWVMFKKVSKHWRNN